MQPIPPYEEASLLRALAEGGRPAFTRLYSGYLDSLAQYVFLFTADRAQAEEIVQDSFLKIWEKRASLGEFESFKAYLFRTAKNQVINHIRREQMHNIG